MIIYICLLGMSIFMLTCFTHPQWMILVMPYIAILECDSWTNLNVKLFCEICMGMSHGDVRAADLDSLASHQIDGARAGDLAAI